MTNSAINTLIDAASALTDSTCEKSAWDRSVALVNSLGAKSINIAHFRSTAYLPTWARVSMDDQDGYEEYYALGYIEIDPILNSRVDGTFPRDGRLSIEAQMKSGKLSAREAALHRLFIANGFTDFIAFRGNTEEKSNETLVVLGGGGEGNNALEAAGPTLLSVLSSLIVFHVKPPSPSDPGGKIPALYEFLSDRERDVLSYLAGGSLNDDIAFRMGISEATVRFHLTNARKKMGARTREQAVALAMARGLIAL